VTEPITIRFGGYQGPQSVHTRGGRALGQYLHEELGDAVNFIFDENIVERGQKAADLLTMVESGELDGCYFSSSYLAGRVPELGVFDQHFVVPDRASAYAILDGELGRELARCVAAGTGYCVMDFWDNGFRHISTANRVITSPQDCKGLTIRTLANEDHKALFRTLGFEPHAIDVRDLPAAVADGTVDAQENPLTNIYNFRLHDTHRHISLTGHLLGVALALFNRQHVEAWPDSVREGVARAMRKATLAQRQFAEEDDAICTAKLRAEGVEVRDLTLQERNVFIEAVAPQIARLRDRFDPKLVALFDKSLARQS